jgi:hypothetical protein
LPSHIFRIFVHFLLIFLGPPSAFFPSRERILRFFK